MATITIPALPAQGTLEPSNLIVVQDGGDTKQMALSVLTNDVDARVSAHTADMEGAHTAFAISANPNAPVMPGINVQLQLDQIHFAHAALDTEVTTVTNEFHDHQIDTTSVHIAAAISCPANPYYLTATDVGTNLGLADTALHDLSLNVARRPIKGITTATYTPIITDENTMITLSNASPITVTLPRNADVAFVVGAEIDFLWLGAGQPTFVAGAGAFVNGTPSLKMRAQFSGVTAKKINTNSWVLLGDLL